MEEPVKGEEPEEPKGFNYRRLLFAFGGMLILSRIIANILEGRSALNVDSWTNPAEWIGPLVFVAITGLAYWWQNRQ